MKTVLRAFIVSFVIVASSIASGVEARAQLPYTDQSMPTYVSNYYGTYNQFIQVGCYHYGVAHYWADGTGWSTRYHMTQATALYKYVGSDLVLQTSTGWDDVYPFNRSYSSPNMHYSEVDTNVVLSTYGHGTYRYIVQFYAYDPNTGNHYFLWSVFDEFTL